MSKCLNAPILIAVPIREAIPEAIRVADRVQGPQDQAVLVLGDHPALVRVDQVVLVMMIVLLVVMTGALLVTVLHVEILVIVRRAEILVIVLLVVMIAVRMIGPLVVILVIVLLVVMIGVLMIGPHVATEQIPAQAVLVLGDHLALVRVDLVVLVMMIVRRVGILVTGLRVVMIGVRMIGLHVATALALVGRLVRDVMTVVMVGDVVVPVKKTLLPGSRAMRRSAGVQQFVPEVVVPFVRI